MNKRTKSLFKKLDLLNIGHNFSTDHTLSDDQLKNLQTRLSKDSTAYKIMLYRKPSTIEEFNEIVVDCTNLGKVVTLEKYLLIYGELGRKKYEEVNYSKAMTLSNMIKKYGEKEGNYRWDQYCKKQAETNTFEYKNKKYGMTEEEFKEYNLNRAVTLENMITRHGEDIGNIKWKEYCERQAYTNTKEHLGDRYEEINKQKAITLENFIRKYGEKEGHEKYINRINSSPFYSKKSQELFDILTNCITFKDKKCYYATNNGEYGVYDKNTKSYKMYDFVCVDLNLCIEFNGDHYHGNPKMYLPSDILKGRGQSNVRALDAWSNDSYKNNLINEERGIDVIVVWESEWDFDKQSVIDRICNYANAIQR